jgi:hypothetical protein
MNVSLDEHRLGGLRWIVVRGPDREAFRPLGEHMRQEIAMLTATWPLLPGFVTTSRARRVWIASVPYAKPARCAFPRSGQS